MSQIKTKIMDDDKIIYKDLSYRIVGLSMLNVKTPPLHGLTSEEVFEKSES